MFYLKMKGDYFRYLSEVASGDSKKGECVGLSSYKKHFVWENKQSVIPLLKEAQVDIVTAFRIISDPRCS